MAETTSISELVGSLRGLGAAVLVLGLLVFGGTNHALSQAYTIDETKFQASNKDFPACKLDTPSSFSARVISFPGEEVELDIIQQDENVYCIHLQDKVRSNTHSLIISGYKFQAIHVSDILQHGQLVIAVLFRAGLFDNMSVAIVDRKFVIGRR